MIEVDWRKQAQKFINSTDDEACLKFLFELHCIFGDIRKLLKTSKISSYKFEYYLGGAYADLVLFHTDGGITLVELKGQNSARDVIGGIGQLFLYEALIRARKPKAPPPKYVDKCLVSPVSGDTYKKVAMACDIAGVDFLQYAGFDLIRAHRRECIKEWCIDGT